MMQLHDLLGIKGNWKAWNSGLEHDIIFHKPYSCFATFSTLSAAWALVVYIISIWPRIFYLFTSCVYVSPLPIIFLCMVDVTFICEPPGRLGGPFQRLPLADCTLLVQKILNQMGKWTIIKRTFNNLSLCVPITPTREFWIPNIFFFYKINTLCVLPQSVISSRETVCI